MTSLNDQTVAAYDHHVQEYIDGTPAEMSTEFRMWLDANLSELSPRAHILELGSANGRDADYIESKGFQIERTDASKGFVDYLRQHGHEARMLNIVTDSLDGDLDMVFADAVLLHLNRDEMAQAARKVYAALKPGGRFVFSLKQGDGEEVDDRKLGTPRYFCYWQVPGIEAVLREAGFATVEHRVNEDYRPGRPGWLLMTAVKKDES